MAKSNQIINSTVLATGIYIRSRGHNRITLYEMEATLKSIYKELTDKLIGRGILDKYYRKRVAFSELHEYLSDSLDPNERLTRGRCREILLGMLDLSPDMFIYPVEVLAAPIDYIIGILDSEDGSCVIPAEYGSSMRFNVAEIYKRDRGAIVIDYLPKHGHYQYVVRMTDIMSREVAFVMESNTNNMDRFLNALEDNRLSDIVITISKDDKLNRAKRLITLTKIGGDVA